MENDVDTPHTIQRVPSFKDQLYEATAIGLSGAKSGVQGIANGASQLLSAAIENPAFTAYTVGAFGLVWIAAATAVETTVKREVQECDCTCLRDLLNPTDRYIGRRGDPNYCKIDCVGLGYYKDSTCPLITKRDELW